MSADGKPNQTRLFSCIQQLSWGEVGEFGEPRVVQNDSREARTEFVVNEELELAQPHLASEKVGFGYERNWNSVGNVGVVQVDPL